jgi:NAD(P)-dependent dehydrogenase (short-subunit alcohol dehydrogenase family)
VHAPSVALVTGGSRGIGYAAAAGLGRLGATVVLVGRDPRAATRSAEALVGQGIDAVGVGCDVGDPDAVDRTVAALGGLAAVDVLVLSAGVMSRERALRAGPAEWDRVLDTNLGGVVNLVRAVGQGMVQRRSGRIIAVSACLGRSSGPGLGPGLGPYRVSKAAVNAYVRTLAADLGLGAKGVLVDAMCPGHCRTDMGGPQAPRSAEEGADTITWLATRPAGPTGLLWEDRAEVPW